MKFQKTLMILGVALAVGMVSLMGCSQQCSAPSGTAIDGEAADAPAIPPELEKYKDTIQKLPESEWAAVYKQKVCPVSGEPLGSMGTPIKVTVEGRDVYLCCAACKSAIEEDPQKYLEKLPK